MNKIESARIIVKQRGICYNFNHSETISCDDCFNGRNRKKCVDFTDEKTLALAEAYIKRHEQKSKKKDHIRDTMKKVESTAVSYEPCVSCRNNHGICSTKERTANVKNCVNYNPIDIEKSYFKNISAKEPKPVKKVGVDNDDVTLAKPTVKENLSVPCEHLVNGDSCGNAFEPCDKDCPANPEIPQPIKIALPDVVFTVTLDGIGKRNVRTYTNLVKDDEQNLLIGGEKCYRTLEEAVIVAKKLWQGEGK